MTHWKKLTNPNYLGVYSLDDGLDLTLTIDKITNELVTGSDGKKETCTICYFLENVKPMIMNKTNLRQIEKLMKTPMIEEWHGKRITIGSEKVKAFGEIVDALRVRKNLPADKPIICSSCNKTLTPFGKMSTIQLAKLTETKYGVILCSDCASKAKKAKDEGKWVNDHAE